jgi:nucleoside-diphosphate-sugar epimerase
MRLLITGPSGFIGTHCLRRLLGEDIEIHAVNRKGAGESDNRVAWHAADMRDASAAVALVVRVRPTHLLHCAWMATPKVYADSPENLDWLRSGTAMLSAFGASGGVRFVGIGSSAEYDPVDSPCIEDETRIRPATVYGKCKAAFWLGAQAAAQLYGLSAAWGRLFLPYGPGDPAQRLVPHLLASLAAGKSVKMTHGAQQRDFIYAPDAADLIVRLLLSSEAGAFNIATGHGTTVRSIAEYLASRYGRADLLEFSVENIRTEPSVLIGDMTKVSSRLGWSAPTRVFEGLDLVVRSFAPPHFRNE